MEINIELIKIFLKRNIIKINNQNEKINIQIGEFDFNVSEKYSITNSLAYKIYNELLELKESMPYTYKYCIDFLKEYIDVLPTVQFDKNNYFYII